MKLIYHHHNHHSRLIFSRIFSTNERYQLAQLNIIHDHAHKCIGNFSSVGNTRGMFSLVCIAGVLVERKLLYVEKVGGSLLSDGAVDTMLGGQPPPLPPQQSLKRRVKKFL